MSTFFSQKKCGEISKEQISGDIPNFFELVKQPIKTNSQVTVVSNETSFILKKILKMFINKSILHTFDVFLH